MINKWVAGSVGLLMAGSAFAVDGSYLSDFDLVWDRLPKAYEESAFVGNGELGTCIWSAREETLHFDIGDTRVYSEKSRAPIGKFVLKAKGETHDFSMRLDLHKALASGEMITSEGKIEFRSLASVKHDVVLVEFTVRGDERLGMEHFGLPGAPADYLYSIRKDKSITLKNQNDFSDPDTFKAIMGMKKVTQLVPEKKGKSEGVHYRYVPLQGGQAYVLSWKFAKVSARRYLLTWTTDYRQKDGDLSETAGIDVVNQAFKLGFDRIRKDHEAYWTDYFAGTFVSLPDKRIEANYWAQMYKYGSAARPGALPIDLMGPWFRATPWPRIWANLNVQLQYLPMPVGGQPGVATTLADWIDANHDIFIQAVDPKFQDDSAACGRGTSPYGPTAFWGEYGNFLWTLYDYWHFLRVYPDDERVVEKFYPILKRANNFLIHALKKKDDGFLHMPEDVSPEWKVKGEDTTYNLELLSWGLETAIYIGKEFELTDSDTKRYEDILEGLVPKHVSDSVIMLGRDLPLTDAHRHYSHLVGLYPLRRIDIDSAEEYELYLNTVNHWLGFKLKYPLARHSWSYKGYTRTGAAPMYAMLDKPEKALDQLKQYFDLYLYPNTFYLETGPVIETPLSSAASTQELLIQSWGINDYATDLVRLFPGVAAEWPEVRFDGLRAEGGYTVSAVHKDGVTRAFCVTASRERSLQLRFKGAEKPMLQTTKGSTCNVETAKGWQIVHVDLKAGESLTFGPQDGFTVPVVDVASGKPYFHFGLNDQFLSTYTPD